MKSFDRRGELETESWQGEVEPAAADDRLEVPERYELGDELGRGGMAVVYAARDRQLDRRVALKVLQAHRRSPELQQRLLREAQVLAKLRHPAVVVVYDVTQHAGRVFVAMELVEGSTLRAWAAEPSAERALAERLAACIAAGRGLAAVHAAGLVHRDFKPDNVLVDRDGAVRVADFGLARLARAGGEDAPLVDAPQGTGTLRTLTHAGQLVGTLPYMAPELMRGEPADARSDQFAFAVTLVEVLGGARPFAGDSLDDHGASLGQAPVIPDVIPSRVRAIAVRALDPDPARRFASMAELLAALDRATGWRAPRRRLALAGGGAAVLAGALALYVTTREDAPSCDLPATVDAAWSPARADAVRRAFDAAKSDPAARDTVVAALDAYHGQLVAAHATACRVRAAEGPDLAARRATCLERRTVELAAIADQLEHLDGKLAARVVGASHNLSAIDECDSVALLGGRVARKPGTLEEGARIDAEIARAKVAHDLGNHEQARAALAKLLEPALALAHPPTDGEVQLILGAALESLDKIPEAEQAYRRAVVRAQEGRDDALLARAAFSLGLDLAKVQRKANEGRPWIELAVATLARLPPSPDLESRVMFALAIIELTMRRLDEAERAGERALELCTRTSGAESTRCGQMINTLGGVALERRDLALADERYRRAHEIMVRANGPDHLQALPIASNLASVAYARGDFERAIQLRLDVVARGTRLLGPNHYNVANVVVMLGVTYERAGRLEEAIATTRTGLAGLEAARGPTFERTIEARIQLARLLVRSGDLAAADAIRSLTLIPAHQIEAHEIELEVARAKGDVAAAVRHADRGLAIARDVLGPVRHEPTGRLALARAQLLRDARDPAAGEAAKLAVHWAEAVFAPDSAPVREARALLSPAR